MDIYINLPLKYLLTTYYDKHSLRFREVNRDIQVHYRGVDCYKLKGVNNSTDIRALMSKLAHTHTHVIHKHSLFTERSTTWILHMLSQA